jgi:hypothetical protein
MSGNSIGSDTSTSANEQEASDAMYALTLPTPVSGQILVVDFSFSCTTAQD